MSERFLSQNWHRIAALRPRLKSGVDISAHRYRGELWYVLRDPASARHHRLTPQALAFAEAMRGEDTVEDIWTSLIERFGDEAPGQNEIQSLLVHFSNADLLASDVAPEITEVARRHDQTKARERAKWTRNPLSITVPLFNPDAICRKAATGLRAVPVWLMLLAYGALILPAFVLGIVHADALSKGISDQILSANNLLALGLLVPLVKLWHEFGHGVILRSYGGHAREFGIMFMAFYPMPYVDASASLAFPSKWQRIHVAAAGMLAEFMLAAIALFVWLSVEDGLVKAMAFNVVLICGVSTLVINANPLLRYDGYYMLCDFLEIPNMASRANQYLGRVVMRHLFRSKTVPAETEPVFERIVFLIYAPLAFVYRNIVLLALAAFVARQYHALGVALAIWSVAIGLVWPALKPLGAVVAGSQLADIRGRAIAITLAGLAATIGMLLVPAPLHSMSEGVVWLPEDATVRAAANGTFVRLLSSNDALVVAGQPIVQMVDNTTEDELTVVRLKAAVIDAQIATGLFGDQARLELLRRERDELTVQEKKAAEKAARLSLKAGVAGQFHVPSAADLPGRYLREGSVIGHIVPQGAQTVRAVVTQADIDLVRQKRRRIIGRLIEQAGTDYPLTLLREVPAASNELPNMALGTAGGGVIAVDPRDKNSLTTLERVFVFDLGFEQAVPPRFGQRVLIRFEHEPEGLAFQWTRRLRQLFLGQFQV